MDNSNRIDGLPGLTLQGKIGNTGNRGSTTFFNILDIDYKKYLGNTTIVCSKFNLSEYYVIPLIGDYIIETFQHKTFIYIIDEISELYILKYIGICDLYKNVNDITLIISKSKTILNYSVWSQNYKKDDDNTVVLDKNNNGITQFSTFDFISKTNINNLRFELEFKHGPCKMGYTSSCMANKYNSDSSISSDKPMGLAENYLYTDAAISFDDEDLGDFNIILKDFEEKNKLSYTYSVTLNIPDVIKHRLKTLSYETEDLDLYNVYLYAYKKESISKYSPYYKIFLGDVTSALINIQ